MDIRDPTVQCFSDSPFVVLAVEEAIEYITERADVVKVVQDDHGGEFCVRLLGVTLLCQVGQVLTQILRRKELAHAQACYISDD